MGLKWSISRPIQPNYTYNVRLYVYQLVMFSRNYNKILKNYMPSNSDKRSKPFQNRPKTAQNMPKTAQKCSKRGDFGTKRVNKQIVTNND